MELWIALTVYLSLAGVASGGAYEDTFRLQQDLFASYSTDIRPLRNQSDKMVAYLEFSLLSIVEVNEMTSQVTLNGVLIARWRDEQLTWSPSNYNGIDRLTPKSQNIWTPPLRLLNTSAEKDLFEKVDAHTTVDFEGNVTWLPGNMLPVTCHLDLRKFPYDTHECVIYLNLNQYSIEEMELATVEEMPSLESYFSSREWDLIGCSNDVVNIKTHTIVTTSAYRVIFRIRRRELHFIVSLFLPISILSVLSLGTFLVPVESGEKVCYSITVLLAFSVYMGYLDAMMPNVSVMVPHANNMFFAAFLISALITFDAIFISMVYRFGNVLDLFPGLQSIKLFSPVDEAGEAKNECRFQRWSYILDLCSFAFFIFVYVTLLAQWNFKVSPPSRYVRFGSDEQFLDELKH